MREIEINGNNYQIGTLDAFKQFHVARRIAPVLFTLSSGTLELIKAGSSSDDLSEMDILKAVGPMVDVISKMSDADSQYVLTTCLSVCSRQSGNGWQRVCVDGGSMMFSDITLHVMLQLAVTVIQDNMGNFMDALSTVM